MMMSTIIKPMSPGVGSWGPVKSHMKVATAIAHAKSPPISRAPTTAGRRGTKIASTCAFERR